MGSVAEGEDENQSRNPAKNNSKTRTLMGEDENQSQHPARNNIIMDTLKGEDENQSQDPAKSNRKKRTKEGEDENHSQTPEDSNSEGHNVKGADENQTQNPVKPYSKKPKAVFPYGNYRNYYGYRIGEDLGVDPRLKVFRKRWFRGKSCLDIGCNNGIVTIQIAKKFLCRRILGIEIDENLVQDAHRILRKAVRLESSAKRPSYASSCRDLPKTVSFQHANILDGCVLRGKSFDTILCLSVAKWIHLNWGDDGLITLFAKIWEMLPPGGIFVFEPQPWKSYERKHLVTQRTAANYHNITLRPAMFQEILLDKIGFRTVEDVTSGLSGTKEGFHRPILVFTK